MKLKLAFSIPLVLIFSQTYCQTDSNLFGSDWKLFEDSVLGYSVEYPSEWIPQGGKGGFICGEEAGYRNAEWTIMWSDTSDLERVDFLFGSDYQQLYMGWKVEEKSILLDSKNGVHYIITNPKNQEDYIEVVELMEGAVWYSFENNVIKDPRFERFYKSFRTSN